MHRDPLPILPRARRLVGRTTRPAAVALALSLAACGGGGSDGADACPVEANVDSTFWCSATAATAVADEGRTLVVTATRPGSDAGLTEEIVLRFPVPASVPATLRWSDEGVVGAFNVMGAGAAHGDEARLGAPVTNHDGHDHGDEEIDRHETRVGGTVSGGELVVTRLDDGAVAGRFSFTAYGVVATDEAIPVEEGRFGVER